MKNGKLSKAESALVWRLRAKGKEMVRSVDDLYRMAAVICPGWESYQEAWLLYEYVTFPGELPERGYLVAQTHIGGYDDIVLLFTLHRLQDQQFCARRVQLELMVKDHTGRPAYINCETGEVRYGHGFSVLLKAA